MTNGVSASTQTSPYSPTLEIVAPLSTRMLFSRARFLKGSPFLHHLPFLFWLVEVCRPQSFVELGVGEGVSYFAACQALEKLNVDAHCYGIDTWPAAEDPAIPSSLTKYNSEQYDDFSQLIRDAPRDAVRRFTDGCIDLLHVDMDPDKDLLDTLTHDWTRKLSRRGVVLLHGIHNRFAEGGARNFLERISDTYPTIVLDGGDGLMIVLYGSEREARLVKLAQLSLGQPGHSEVRRVFRRLGATHHFEWTSRAEASKADSARKKQDVAQKELKTSQELIGDLERKLSERDAAYDKRSDQIAEMQARLFDLKQARNADAAALAETRKKLEARSKEIKDLTRAQEERDRRIAELTEDRDAAKGDLERVRQESAETLAARDAALAETREELETRSKEVADLTRAQEERDRRIAELTEDRDAAKGELERLRQESAETLAARDAALAETREKLEAKSAALIAEEHLVEERFQEIITLTRAHEERARKVAELTEDRDAAKRELERVQKESAEALAARDAALAEARKELEAKSAALSAKKDSLEARFQEIRALTEKLDGFALELEAAQSDRDALLHSTSWKLTAPARRVVNQVRAVRS